MNLKLPFYGKRGTISKIIENEKTYTVTKYGVDGKEEIKLTIPKKKKNYDGLLQNYYQDMKCYLDQNYDKYFDYKSTRLKKKINMNHVSLGKYISIISFTIGASLMFFSANSSMVEVLSYSGLILSASSISGFCAAMNLTKEYKKDTEKAKFIACFNSYSKELDSYYRSLNYTKNHTPTEFLGIKKENTYGNTIQKKKVKVLDLPDGYKPKKTTLNYNS